MVTTVIPSDATPFEMVLAILSVTLTTLGLLALGGIAKWFFGRHKRQATFRKKLWLFPAFIAGIFAVGALSALTQQAVYAYLRQNVATSITGFAVAVLVAWFLYDWTIWRRN